MAEKSQMKLSAGYPMGSIGLVYLSTFGGNVWYNVDQYFIHGAFLGYVYIVCFVS